MSDRKLKDFSTANMLRHSQEGAPPRLVPALTVISHPVPQRAGERLLLEELTSGECVAVSRIAPDFLRCGDPRGMPLADPFLSRKPLLFEPTAQGGVRLRVAEGGTRVSVAEVPLTGTREFSAQELSQGVPLVLSERVVLLLHQVLIPELLFQESLGMLGHSGGTRQVRDGISRVADLKVPVLIRGETGSGKELVAHAIHERSSRRKGPFVSVNLGALPKELAAAELFGACRGAYTGATHDRRGFFQAAHGGTLFLDEVGEAPPEVQVLLLRVLETGEVFPVGGHAPVPVDVRLVTATDANLDERILEGLFKAPLLHRLAGFEIWVPPLRERREDLGVLFHHFARQELEALGEAHRLERLDAHGEPWLPAPLAVRLVQYSWPGNIRQLRNLTRQIVISSRNHPSLQLGVHLQRELESSTAPQPKDAPSAPAAPGGAMATRRRPAEVSDQELLEALRAMKWDMKAAAERLGISRPSLYMLIDRSPSLRTVMGLEPREIARCFEECQGDVDVMVQHLKVSRRGLQRRLKSLGLSAA